MALERDPGLLEYAISKDIILTFPTSLLAILKGLAMNIQQSQLAQNIDEIQKNAVELYKRYAIFTDKFNAVGANISKLKTGGIDPDRTDEEIDAEVRVIKPES